MGKHYSTLAREEKPSPESADPFSCEQQIERETERDRNVDDNACSSAIMSSLSLSLLLTRENVTLVFAPDNPLDPDKRTWRLPPPPRPASWHMSRGKGRQGRRTQTSNTGTRSSRRVSQNRETERERTARVAGVASPLASLVTQIRRHRFAAPSCL